MKISTKLAISLRERGFELSPDHKYKDPRVQLIVIKSAELTAQLKELDRQLFLLREKDGN